jgi:6-phosphogluconolactonase
MPVEIHVVDDPPRACAAMLVGASVRGGNVVLTGGSTPRDAYQELAVAVQKVRLDVGNTTFWFGDERCVGPDDERSNFRMVRESLIEQLDGVVRLDVRRMEGELGPEAAADAYERQLREAGPPRFDLLLLGIGPDGHTLSLFPDQASLSERDRLVIGVEQAGHEPFVSRVTMTLPAVELADQVVFLASGASKADAVGAAFGPDARPDPHVPASMIAPLCDKVTVIVDAAAADKL